MKKNIRRAFLCALFFLIPNLLFGEKITDYTQLVSGQQYYIGATTTSPSTDYYFSAANENVGTGIKGTAVTDKTAATKVTAIGADDSWAFQLSNGNYLSLKDVKDNGKVAVVNAEAKWTLSNTNSSLVNMTINGYCLQRNNTASTTNFGSYQSGQKDVWFELVPAEKPFTATLYANGAKHSELTESKAGAGVELPTLTSPCDDWSFVGWAETAIAETSARPTIIEAGTYKPTKDVTLYAVYSKSEDNGSGETQAVFDVKTIASENNWNNGTAYLSYTIAPITITYSGGGNNGKYYSSDNSWRIYTGGTITITSQSGTITKVTTTPTNTFTKQTNGSWVFNATKTVQFTKFTVSYSGGSTTTYASVPVCGTTQSSTISFDLNGGTGTALASVTGEVGKTITLPTAEGITKDGCTFAGWNTKADGTGTDYAAGTDFTVPASDATLYAKWQQTQQTPATITLSENGAETPFADGATYYVGSQIALPTTADGNCNKSVSFVGWSEVEITNSAVQPATNFYAPGATYTIQNQSTKLYAVYAKTTLGVFRKVTTTPADWTGEYLIVCESESVVFDGSISSGTSGKELDVAGNNQPVTINDNTIALADGQDYTFFIAKSGSGYTLQSKSGYYIGGASSNGITCNKTKTYIHTLSLNATTNATTIKTSDKAGILRFNTNRFRYYTSNTTGKPIALYVKEIGSCFDYSTTCSAAIDVAVPAFSVKEGTYSNAQSVEITCATSGAKIYYTTDGTEPTNASTLYTGAITVDKSMTIKAIAYADDYNYSDVAAATYSILQASDVKWQTYGDDGSSKADLTETTIYTDGDLEVFVYTASTGEQTFTSTDPNVATVEMKTGLLGEYPALNVKGAGTTTITVNVAADDTYAAGSASFVLHVKEHKQVVTMSFAETSYTAKLGEAFAAPALTVSPTVTPIIYSSSNAKVAMVDATTGAITLLAMGVTTIKADYAGDEVYDPASAQYTLHVVDPYADILTADKLTATNTTYKDFKDVIDVTGTLYAGYTAKDSEGSIQMNTKNKNSGIVSTSSMGFVKSITITFAKAGSINVYGNTSPYASAADLYEANGNNQGVKLGTLSGAAGETVSLTITDGYYPYIGIRSQSNAMYLKEIAISWTPATVVRSGLTAGRYGTICLEHNATAMLGASFYEIAYRVDKGGTPSMVCFDEVTALEAGVPYIFLAEDEQITVVYGDETATVAGSRNGLVGTFEAIADGDAGAAGNVLEGNYLVNNNMIRLCGGNCNLPAYRAYIRMNEVSTNMVAPAPGRRRITLQNADTQVSTGLNGISEDSSVAPQQEGIYDVLGHKLEQTAGTGFYIIDGKKQVVIK